MLVVSPLQSEGSYATNYFEWQDGNLNGQIDGTGFASNGTIDDNDERRYPISYVRSVQGAPSRIKPALTFEFKGALDGNLKVKGDAGGGKTFGDNGGIAVADMASAEIDADADLPGLIDSRNLAIAWQASTDDGATWFDLVTTTNHLYVTGADAGGAFETVVHLGSEGAKGVRPRNAGEAGAVAAAKDKQVVDGVWARFSGRVVERVDGKLMSYSHASNAAGDPEFGFSAAEMLGRADGQGQCTAWADLLIVSLRAQGMSAVTTRIDPPGIPLNRRAFAVKLMPAQGTAGVDYKVGTLAEDGFNFHQVVRVSGLADSIYDPSYGGLTEKTDARSVELKYEDENITHAWDQAPGMFIPDNPGDARQLIFTP